MVLWKLRSVLHMRPLTTGRYESREALVAAVWNLWDQPRYRQSHIARITKVSAGTVAKILNQRRPG